MSIVPGALCLNLCVQELMTALEVSEAAVSPQKTFPKNRKVTLKKNSERNIKVLMFGVMVKKKKKKKIVQSIKFFPHHTNPLFSENEGD